MVRPSEASAPIPSTPPRTPYEEAILAIWSDVLGRSSFGVHDDFFELGGHSLLAPKVVARIRKTLGVQIPVRDLFRSPTVAELASAVADQSSAGSGVIDRRASDGPSVLSFDQQRLWLESQLLPSLAYNVHGRRRLLGSLDLDGLQASVRAILLRHESLRTRFPVLDGRPVQVVDDFEQGWRIDVRDVSGAADPDAEAQRLTDEQASTAFDLAAGPLFRCMVVKLSDREHILGITAHHIVCDNWSVGLFVRELSALYGAGGDPQRAGLPTLPIQYRDYATWQRQRLVGEPLERAVSYWRKHLDGAPPALTMPSTHRRVAALRLGGQLHTELSEVETAALHDLCRQHGVSPFMTLLAVLATMLARWSGQRDLVVGVPIAGRTDAGTDTLIGFLVNTLPIRVDLTGDPTFADLLGRVRQVCLDGYAHSDAPLDVLVEQLEITRDPRRTPLFEVILNVVANTESEQLPGLAVEAMDAPTLPSKFDLALTAREFNRALQIFVDFNRDRYDEPLVRVFVSQLKALLRATIADPSRGLLSYDLGTPTPALSAEPVPSARPAPRSGRVAVVAPDGDRTYGWLGPAVDLLARRIAGSAHVDIVRRPSAGFVAAVLACVGAGVAYSLIEAGATISRTGATTVDVAVESVDVTEAPVPREERCAPDGGWAVERFNLTGDDRFAALGDEPGHLVAAASHAFTAGGTLILAPPSVGDIGAWLRDNAVSVVYLSPQQVRGLTGPLPALRYAFVDNTGDLIAHDVEAIRRLSPAGRVVAVYRVDGSGLPRAAYLVPEDWQPSTAPLRVPLGWELPGAPARLAHPGGEAAAVGEVASLWFGADQTGDLARRWPDGTLEYVGRLGASLTFDPVETVAALRDLPNVTDAVVTELVDSDANPTLVGYVATQDPSHTAATIRQRLVVRLPEYLIPRLFLVLDELPRAADGTYDMSAFPVPDWDSDADTYMAPRTPIERALTEIFQELLEVERIGVHDTFFELNGFSLLATQLASRIRETFTVDLPLREVFGSPTVEGLAQLILRTQSELSDADQLEALLAEVESQR
jgi:non-ribosomal peptide synthetase component F/acyl carrier protein